MKFTELFESKAKEDEPIEEVIAEPTEIGKITDEEKLEVPKKSEKDPNGHDAWYQLCKREADRVNAILAYKYGDLFRYADVELDDNKVAHVKEEKPTGAVAVYMDDDAWYFELVFDASDGRAFDTAMDIIEDYKEVVHLPDENAFIFESMAEDGDEKTEHFFRFVSWCDGVCNATSAECFVNLCDWFDRIKRMCFAGSDFPNEIILKRIEMNNEWNKMFCPTGMSKSSANDVKKKAEVWEKVTSYAKGREYLKGNKVD